jgi:hypothetical protein
MPDVTSTGRLSTAHVLELEAVVTPETSAEESAGWIARAERLSFRSLQQVVKKTQEEGDGETADGAAAAASTGAPPGSTRSPTATGW